MMVRLDFVLNYKMIVVAVISKEKSGPVIAYRISNVCAVNIVATSTRLHPFHWKYFLELYIS